MEEKRAHPRVETFLTVRWDGSTTNTDVRISDLSLGGCFVDTVTEALEGETVTLQILLPSNEWLDIQGVVVHHHRRFGFGLRFEDLDDMKRQQIWSLLIPANRPEESPETHENYQSQDFQHAVQNQ